jgi:hypothetical protein
MTDFDYETHLRNKFGRAVLTCVVVKRRGRLMIRCYETNETIYCPPDFIQILFKTREPMIDLATEMIYYDEITEKVIEFETRMRP